jgi:transcriptional regulator with XRE-family HTH domain
VFFHHLAIFFLKITDFLNMGKAKNPIIVRIDDLLAAQKKGRKELIAAVGANRGALTNWDKRGTVPAADVALKIADYLGVSVRWLVTGQDEKDLTLEERNLLSKYSRLDNRDRYEVNALLDAKLAGNLTDMKRAKSS